MTMKLTALILLSIFIVSCDGPRRDRFVSTDLESSPAGSYSDGDMYSNTDSSTTTDGSEFVDGSDVQNLGAGYQLCDLGFQYNISNLGYFGMCKHETYENSYKVKFDSSPPLPGVCFVPMHAKTDGSSFKVGTPECIQSHLVQAKSALNLNFPSKELPDRINAVMVLKSDALNSFLGCQNAKASFYRSNGCFCDQSGSCNKSICYQANQYAQGVCQSFVQNHTSSYRLVNFE